MKSQGEPVISHRKMLELKTSNVQACQQRSFIRSQIACWLRERNNDTLVNLSGSKTATYNLGQCYPGLDTRATQHMNYELLDV